MMENEDSVVTSLNELRKLKIDRISRLSHARAASASRRATVAAEDPIADQLTPPPAQGMAAAAVPVPEVFDTGSELASPAANRFAATSFQPGPMVLQAPPIIQTRTSYKAAVVMTLLLGGAGAVGYLKLQNDTQTLLAAKTAELRNAEDARMRSVEAATKADAVARTNLRMCEDKLRAGLAAATPTASPTVAQPVVAPAVEKRPERAMSMSKRASRRAHAAPKQVAQRSGESSGKAQKSADIPTIAKKKKVDNDPLAGIGL
ncbi:MAG: hypothetical protein ABSB49_08330 [Polyangia bacterium]|jgi:hypothetical protein